MRIVIPTGIFPPDIGGPASSVPLLASQWSAQGHDVAVATYSDERADAEDGGRGYGVLRVRRTLPLPFRYGLFFWKTFRAAKGADLVFAQDGVASGFPGLLAARLRAARFALKLVGDFAWEHACVQDGYEGTLLGFQKDRKICFGKKLMRALQRFVVRRADLVIVPSRHLRELALGWGAKEERLRVVYNGIRKAKPEERKRSRHCVLGVGRLVPFKRFDVLIDAMPAVLERHRDAALVLVGDGPERAALEERAEKLGIGRHVRFTGAMRRDEVMEAMRACGVYVHPSAYEGFAHQVLEAFAARIPVVASRIPGNDEIVRDGKNGLLVPVGNAEAVARAVLKLMDDPDLADRLVAEAASDVRAFSLERQISETTEALLAKAPLRPLLIGRDPETADPATFAAERMSAYAARVEAMHVLLAADAPRMKRTAVRNFTAELVPSRPRLLALLRLPFAALFAARRHRANLIMAQDPFELGAAASFAAFFLRIPFLVEDHGAFYAGPHWRRESLLNRFRWLLGRLVARRAAGIRAVSSRVKDSWKAKKGRAIAVVPVAMDLEPKPVPVPKGPFTILYAGRFAPEKNLPMLLAAFELLKKEAPDAKLILAGAGPEERDLRQEIAYLGFEDAVSIRPWTRDMRKVFAEAHAAALPSLYEGYGRFAAEALAAGLPVVMTDVGCANELVRDGKEGFVVPVEDVAGFATALRRLAVNPEMRLIMRDAALLRAASLPALEETAERMVRFWKDAQRL